MLQDLWHTAGTVESKNLYNDDASIENTVHHPELMRNGETF